MDTTLENMKLKRAWQTAFELRTCPDANILYAQCPDENLQSHLKKCHLCREKLEMSQEQRAAWRELHRHFSDSTLKLATPSQKTPGQVWALKPELAGWGKDGYFYKPPMVLLIEAIEGSRGFKAVQLYFDKHLMGDGDVWLGDSFGFAQGWNSYTIHEETLGGCCGAVAEELLSHVRDTATMHFSPVEEDSILYFFRKMEVHVGAHVAMPSVAVLIEEIAEEIVTVKELVQGIKLELVRSGERLKERILTVVRDGLDTISGHFTPLPCLVERTTSDEVMDNSEIELLANDAHFQYVPTGIYVAEGNAHIIMKFLAPCVDKPLVLVRFRNVSIDSKNIFWDGWNTKTPELVIVGVSFTLAEEKRANPLLVMHVSEGSTIFEIMP